MSSGSRSSYHWFGYPAESADERGVTCRGSDNIEDLRSGHSPSPPSLRSRASLGHARRAERHPIQARGLGRLLRLRASDSQRVSAARVSASSARTSTASATPSLAARRGSAVVTRARRTPTVESTSLARTGARWNAMMSMSRAARGVRMCCAAKQDSSAPNAPRAHRQTIVSRISSRRVRASSFHRCPSTMTASVVRGRRPKDSFAVRSARTSDAVGRATDALASAAISCGVERATAPKTRTLSELASSNFLAATPRSAISSAA